MFSFLHIWRLLSPWSSWLRDEDKFHAAVRKGQVQEVRRLLEETPVDVNWADLEGKTPLHVACRWGHTEIVSLLLEQPEIDVNVRDRESGGSPFFVACQEGRTDCAWVLLEDKRVLVNCPASVPMEWASPLSQAAFWGHVGIVRRWIASGRELDLARSEKDGVDAIAAAKRVEFWHSDMKLRGKIEVTSLLELFIKNPVQTRAWVRQELRYHERAAAALFAQVVFLCDGLVTLPSLDSPTTSTKTVAEEEATRFFGIAGRLPMELQMVLCHRVVGSTRDIIQTKDTEVALKSLVKALYRSSSSNNHTTRSSSNCE